MMSGKMIGLGKIVVAEVSTLHLYNLPNCIQVLLTSRKYLVRMDNLFITARLKKKQNRSYLDIHWRLLLTLIVTSFHSALLSLIAELLFSISMILLLPSRFFWMLYNLTVSREIKMTVKIGKTYDGKLTWKPNSLFSVPARTCIISPWAK